MPATMSPSRDAKTRMSSLTGGVNTTQIARKLWESRLTVEERSRLLLEVETVDVPEDEKYLIVGERFGGAGGMWQFLRGVSRQRAALEVGLLVNLVTDDDYNWLMREYGEIDDNLENVIQRAIESGHLVLRDNPRGVHWRGEKININWKKFDADWTYFSMLCQLSKGRGRLHLSDFVHFEDIPQATYLVKTRSRLLSRKGFPVELGDLIQQNNDRTQQLSIPPEEIRIFVTDRRCVIREWTA